MAETIDLRVGANGRMVLPKALRKAMGLAGDTKVIATLDGEELRLTPIHHGARRAQELYRQHVKNDQSTDDFLADRRAEADAELREDDLADAVSCKGTPNR